MDGRLHRAGAASEDPCDLGLVQVFVETQGQCRPLTEGEPAHGGPGLVDLGLVGHKLDRRVEPALVVTSTYLVLHRLVTMALR